MDEAVEEREGHGRRARSIASYLVKIGARSRRTQQGTECLYVESSDVTVTSPGDRETDEELAAIRLSRQSREGCERCGLIHPGWALCRPRPPVHSPPTLRARRSGRNAPARADVGRRRLTELVAEGRVDDLTGRAVASAGC